MGFSFTRGNHKLKKLRATQFQKPQGTYILGVVLFVKLHLRPLIERSLSTRSDNTRGRLLKAQIAFYIFLDFEHSVHVQSVYNLESNITGDSHLKILFLRTSHKLHHKFLDVLVGMNGTGHILKFRNARMRKLLFFFSIFVCLLNVSQLKKMHNTQRRTL